MTWVSFHISAAIILLGGGLLACFFGYRLHRLFLAFYGLVGGLAIGSFLVGDLPTFFAILVVMATGVAGAVLAMMAYLAGVAVFGAGLGAFALNFGWATRDGDPNVWLVLSACLTGALLSLAGRRYVLIFFTASFGAWTVLVGSLALVGNSAAVSALMGNVEYLPPVSKMRSDLGFMVAWVGLTGLAVFVQVWDGRRRPLIQEQQEKSRQKGTSDS
jgi:hypothetical protein